MRRIRVIPTMLINERRLVKTIHFKNEGYVGDPVNAMRIFNEKEVDEICVLDIAATRKSKAPDLEFIRQLAGECFMPLCYGGGVTTVEQAIAIYKAGVEKIVFGTAAYVMPDVVRKVSSVVGAQSVVVSIDYKKDWLGRLKVYVNNGTKNTGLSPFAFAGQMQALGVGELLLQNIDREASLKGFDLDTINEISTSVNIPVVASGGAGSVTDFLPAIQAGASAVAAGYMFVYNGPHKAVIISYPSQTILQKELYSKI